MERTVQKREEGKSLALKYRPLNQLSMSIRGHPQRSAGTSVV